MSDQSFVPLASLASDVTSGVTPQSGNERYYSREGYPFVKIDDLTATADRLVTDTFLHVTDAALRETGLKLYPAGTILISMYGTIGLVKVAGGEVTANQALGALIPPFRCDSAFLYHFLVWARPQWDTFKAQTTQANINGAIVKSLKVRLPELSEQRRIAEILDSLDDQIRLTEKVLAKLENSRTGLVDDVLNENDFEQAVQLGSLSEVGAGVTLGSEPSGPGTVSRPYLRVANVQDGHLDLRHVKSVRVRRSDLNRFELAPGDVLMNEGGDADKLGRGAVWEGQIVGCLHQNHVFRVRCHPQLNPHYLSLITGSAIGKRYFLSASKQTTNLATINSQQIKQFPVPLRDLARQCQIVESVAAFTKRIEKERLELAKAQLIKSGLMADLLSGQVRALTETAS